MPHDAEVRLAHAVIAQFGPALVSYISGVEVGYQEPWYTDGVPSNVGLTINKLHELRVEVAASGQPLSYVGGQLALQGYFDELREELGGQLSEIVSSDPLVQSLSQVLRGLSTLTLAAPYLYAYEPSPGAIHQVRIWNPDLESSFRRSVAEDPALQDLLSVEKDIESPGSDESELAKSFQVNRFLNTILESCYVTARLRRKTTAQEIAEIVHELLQAARDAFGNGVATVSYFSVFNGIGLTDTFQCGSAYFYPMNDVCHDILMPDTRPAIGGSDHVVMGFVLELRHRRKYVEKVESEGGQRGYEASPESPAELERQFQAVPLAIALSTQLAGRAVWISVADPRFGALPFSFKSDSHALRGGLIEASSHPEIVEWLELLNRLQQLLESISDLAVPLARRMLVNQSGAHVAVAHSGHQLSIARTAGGARLLPVWRRSWKWNPAGKPASTTILDQCTDR
jgi:hypothetical protein